MGVLTHVRFKPLGDKLETSSHAAISPVTSLEACAYSCYHSLCCAAVSYIEYEDFRICLNSSSPSIMNTSDPDMDMEFYLMEGKVLFKVDLKFVEKGTTRHGVLF